MAAFLHRPQRADGDIANAANLIAAGADVLKALLGLD